MSPRKISIVCLPGDGVGPEIVAEAVKVLKVISEHRSDALGAEFEFKNELIGLDAMKKTGEPLPDSSLEACKQADAILLGAVGGLPGAQISSGPRPEQGLLKLRKELDLYANLRPVSFASDSLTGLSPLKDHVVQGTDFVFVRELVGGIYFGDRKEAGEDGKGKYNCFFFIRAGGNGEWLIVQNKEMSEKNNMGTSKTQRDLSVGESFLKTCKIN